MRDFALCALVGWLSPFAVFGLYSLVHFVRPRRPIPSSVRLRNMSPVAPLGDDGPAMFFIEVATNLARPENDYDHSSD